MMQFAEAQMEYNRMLEKWRPGYNELQRKAGLAHTLILASDNAKGNSESE